MENIENVEKEIGKVITKFSGINQHSDLVLNDVINFIKELKNSIDISEYHEYYI